MILAEPFESACGWECTSVPAAAAQAGRRLDLYFAMRSLLIPIAILWNVAMSSSDVGL